MAIKQGETLKRIMKERKLKVAELAASLHVHPQTIFFYYNQDKINYRSLLRICEVLNVKEDIFKDEKSLNKFLLNDPDLPMNLDNTNGQGKKLESLMKLKGVDVSALAKIFKVSRPTLYKTFEKEVLPDNILLAASQYFNLPTTYFTGGQNPLFKDNDIWLLLHQLNEKSDRMQAQLDLLTNELIKPKQ